MGLESPEHLGRGERHGDIFKTNMKRIIRTHNITSKLHMKWAAVESLAEKNEYLRRGGFRPLNGFSVSHPEASAIYSMTKK